ncbi:MAG TPA: 6-phosphogluconolactonase [Rhodothermales bacterium]|nr:6-phosphogluconolactonase [Rhodothermales bacterium]
MLHIFPSLEALSMAAARRIVELTTSEVPGEPYLVALSGGNTPKRLQELLATTFRAEVPWERVHLFWGDERWVPPGDENSNYRMAEETLIRYVPIPPENVHPVQTDLASPEASAAAYENEIVAMLEELGRPGMDLVLLGMGDDGHTASLFPGTPVLNEHTRLVTAMEAPLYATVKDRVTFTYALLNRSRHILFLAAGAGKREPFTAIQQSRDAALQKYPAAGVEALVSTEWFVDEAAAGGLRSR